MFFFLGRVNQSKIRSFSKSSSYFFAVERLQVWYYRHVITMIDPPHPRSPAWLLFKSSNPAGDLVGRPIMRWSDNIFCLSWSCLKIQLESLIRWIFLTESYGGGTSHDLNSLPQLQE